MGGFVSQNGHPIATLRQLEDPFLGPKYISAMRAVQEDDITDKSKGDALSKGVALSQSLWFITQFVARFTQRLPPTQLEIATFAFAIVNIFIWLLWWGKPLDVKSPIPVGPAEELRSTEYIGPLDLPHFSDPIFGFYDSFNPIMSTSVPALWSIERTSKHHRSILRAAAFIACPVGVIFGGINCFAWNAQFPSSTDMNAWRWASSIVTSIPALIAVYFLLGKPVQKLVEKLPETAQILLENESLSIIPFYIIPRLVLIVLSFSTLHAVAPGVFIDVDWTAYIPHL
jgi:hypothetical protein